MNYVQTSIPLSGSLLRGAHANNFVIDGVELPPGEWLAHRALSLDRRVQHGTSGLFWRGENHATLCEVSVLGHGSFSGCSCNRRCRVAPCCRSSPPAREPFDEIWTREMLAGRYGWWVNGREIRCPRPERIVSLRHQLPQALRGMESG